MRKSSSDISLARLDFLARIGQRLRESDREELAAITPGVDPVEAIYACAAFSLYCRIIVADGEPMAVTGVIANGDGSFAPWLVGTDMISKNPVRFMRAVKTIMAHYRARFLPLENYVDARQDMSRKFIEALGFTVEEPVDMANGSFCKFHMSQGE